MTQLIDAPKVTGMVTLKHLDANGNVLKEQTVKNLVVDTGLAHIAARLKDGSIPAQMSHMALGTSNTAPAANNTALGAQAGSRSSLTVAGGTPSAATVTYSANFGAGVATGSIVEAGIFNASSGGTMLCRTVFDVITKGVNDSLSVTWVITVS